MCDPWHIYCSRTVVDTNLRQARPGTAVSQIMLNVRIFFRPQRTLIKGAENAFKSDFVFWLGEGYEMIFSEYIKIVLTILCFGLHLI